MRKNFAAAALPFAFCLVLAAAAACPAQSGGAEESLVTEGTFKGSLNVGRVNSYVVHVGEQSGDFAAFCFANRSRVGRAVLAACRNGDVCEFTGTVDQGAECRVTKELRGVLSASGKILSVKSVRSHTRKKRRRLRG